MLEYPVTTPENVRFHYTLAGPGSRLLAAGVDFVVVGTALFVLAVIFAFAQSIFGQYAMAVYAVVAFAVGTGYWIVLEQRWHGRTVGKRALGLRVVGERGLRLGLGQVVLRNVLRAVDMLPVLGGVGAALMLLHPEHRRLGDLVAGTLVVRERKIPPPERIRGAFGRGAAIPGFGLPADAQRRLRAEQREFLLDLCLRRDALDDGVRMRLFHETAAWLRELLGIPQPKSTSDEKLVLAVTAELWERLGRSAGA
jgi:uncharacterized RDD family membrane protein YckC